MRDALLSDLCQLPGLEILFCHDSRLAPPSFAAQRVPVHANDAPWSVWQQCIAEVNAVWPIAPEMDGALLKLSRLVSSQGKKLLGCSPEAVNLAGSKLATCKALENAAIPSVPTYKLQDFPGNGSAAWVAKPDDGVGCEETGYFESVSALLAFMQGREATHVIQPLRDGIPASISMLCRDGRAWLLSCNLQKIDRVSSEDGAGRFRYSGSVLNGAAEYWRQFDILAGKIARAVPDLLGYVGVDLLVGGGGVEVLEINPRLTTSYAGLHEAIGRNPARLVLDLFYNSQFELPPVERNIVDISLNAD